jgi:SpoVK/Ycf46/Vps4 family AAA+-type ATPase
MIRTTPTDVSDPEAFRANVQAALSGAAKATGLRFAGGNLPVDDASSTQLVHVDPFPEPKTLVLNDDEQTVLDDIRLERSRPDVLNQHGIPLTRTLLFTGPPGVGKTLAAKWLASQLELPLVVLALSATVSSHLGSSGKNIKAVLDYAQSGPCVLLLDEFDAIAKNRDDMSDIGELKRLVNVVLTELDRWPTSSVLVAATNHEHLLDPAISRRFDTILRFNLPDAQSRQRMFSNLEQKSQLAHEFIASLAEATEGATGSDIEKIWNAAARRSVLHETPLDEALGNYVWRFVAENGRQELAYHLLSNHLGWSNRRIAAHAGVTHPTIATALRRREQRHE